MRIAEQQDRQLQELTQRSQEIEKMTIEREQELAELIRRREERQAQAAQPQPQPQPQLQRSTSVESADSIESSESP
jgi:hypothetical protein